MTTQNSILSSPIPEFDGRPGINSYQDMYKFSLEHPETFWGTLARSRLEWIKDFDTVQDCNFEEGKISWFLDGKINVAGKILKFHYFRLEVKISGWNLGRPKSN